MLPNQDDDKIKATHCIALHSLPRTALGYDNLADAVLFRALLRLDVNNRSSPTHSDLYSYSAYNTP